MLSKFFISFAIYLLVFGASADELVVKPDNPGQYTVVKGDTLWGISARFLKQPWRWQEIWGMNPHIANPQLIYPGDVITLTYQNGKPLLSLERNAGEALMTGDKIESAVSGRNIKLSPTARLLEREDAIPTIPIDIIRPFLMQPLVLEYDEIDKWPYIVSSKNEHLIATQGNTIYVRGIRASRPALRYSIYRKGEPYVDPEQGKRGDEKILGYEAIYVGDATLKKTGDPASAVITSIEREVLEGDRLRTLPNEKISADFTPKQTNRTLEGNILSVVGGMTQISQYQVVVLNLGKDQDIEPGDVLGIYHGKKTVKDKIVKKQILKTRKEIERDRDITIANATSDVGETATKIGYMLQDAYYWFNKNFPSVVNKQDKVEEVNLPEEYAGVVMVFRAFDKLSYALVMEVRGPVSVLDKVKSIDFSQI